MSKRQQLVALYAMLDHVAQEAKLAGFGLVTTLSAAAAEAARDELRAIDRLAKPRDGHRARREREKADTLV